MLLAKLPRNVMRDFAPQLERVDLVTGQVLHPHSEAARQVHFPLGCVLSVLVKVEDSRLLEVALVGCEGLEGFPVLPGSGLPFLATVQSGGPALRIASGELSSAMRRHPSLDAAVHGHAASLTAQIATNAGCNHFHLLEPRLARRLLMTRDRLDSATFRLTQEFLSKLLSVRRVGISEAASSLQRRGLIEYHRGQMTILDHPGLEAASCSCSRDWQGSAPHRRAAGARAFLGTDKEIAS
jgi:hypothetical protein